MRTTQASKCNRATGTSHAYTALCKNIPIPPTRQTTFIPPLLPPHRPHLVRAKPISLLVGLNREAIVEQKTVIALLPVAVVDLRSSLDTVQSSDRERPALVVVRPFRLPRPARRNTQASKKTQKKKREKNVPSTRKR